jgi:glycosyltransferase involved in cell wall biosynthesis
MGTYPSRLETASVLSVIIPVYNEAQTIGRILQQVVGAVPETPKQIVIVDDCSTDGTSEWLRRHLAHSDGIWRGMSLNDKGDLILSADGPQNQGEFWFTVLFHEHNRGKGAALRTGFSYVSGDVIVIQDADLEYDPGDWAQMLPLINERKVADVVYGSRFYGRPHRSLYFHHYIGNRLISLF